MNDGKGPVRRRPGGEIASRPLHFIWLCDCSGSMSGEKIQSLNFAIREAVPAMRAEATGFPHAKVLVRAIRFADGAQWVDPEPVPIDAYAWKDVRPGGITDMGAALTLLAAELSSASALPEAHLPPVLVLISDGQPTDDFDAGLRDLLATPTGAKSVRIAIAVGADADFDTLKRFIGEGEMDPLPADNAAELIQYIRWASTVPLRVASTPGTTPATVLVSSSPATDAPESSDDDSW
ncbi:MAG: hypothetical protein NVS3B7_06650 [Candidatus Elarobacter sp.]